MDKEITLSFLKILKFTPNLNLLGNVIISRNFFQRNLVTTKETLKFIFLHIIFSTFLIHFLGIIETLYPLIRLVELTKLSRIYEFGRRTFANKQPKLHLTKLSKWPLK